jgi:hypothetical protein
MLFGTAIIKPTQKEKLYSQTIFINALLANGKHN